MSVLLFTLGSLFCALAETLLLLDVARVIQGLGGAMMVPVSRLVLIRSFAKHQFLAALNTATLPGLIGPIIGPLLGGYLVDTLSWHWIFLINVPVGLLGIVVALKAMPNIQVAGVYFDLTGFLLIALTILSFNLALAFVGHQPAAQSGYDKGSILVGLLGLGAYYCYAKHNPQALFPITLFSLRSFKVGIIGNFLTRIGISAIPFLIPLLLQLVFQQSSFMAGWMLMPMAMAAFLMKTRVKQILTWLGYKKVLLGNTVLIALLIINFAFVTLETSRALLFLLLFILGLANSLQFTAMNSLTLSELSGSLASSGNSMHSTNQQLALGGGVALASLLLRFFQSDEGDRAAALLSAFHYSFIILGLITLLSAAVFLLLTDRDGRNLIDPQQTVRLRP